MTTQLTQSPKGNNGYASSARTCFELQSQKATIDARATLFISAFTIPIYDEVDRWSDGVGTPGGVTPAGALRLTK